jgi:hypothetical protein
LDFEGDLKEYIDGVVEEEIDRISRVRERLLGLV